MNLIKIQIYEEGLQACVCTSFDENTLILTTYTDNCEGKVPLTFQLRKVWNKIIHVLVSSTEFYTSKSYGKFLTIQFISLNI